jgi:hypothetical protein
MGTRLEVSRLGPELFERDKTRSIKIVSRLSRDYYGLVSRRPAGLFWAIGKIFEALYSLKKEVLLQDDN